MTPEETRALIAELRSAAGAGREGTHTGYSPLLRGADLATRAADALEALTVPDGDARERLLAVLSRHGHVEWDALDVAVVADTVLAEFPALSRDIAGEIEAEAKKPPRGGLTSPRDMAYQDGLRRAAEIARSGR